MLINLNENTNILGKVNLANMFYEDFVMLRNFTKRLNYYHYYGRKSGNKNFPSNFASANLASRMAFYVLLSMGNICVAHYQYSRVHVRFDR